MANLSNINNKFIVTDGGNGRVLIGATNDIGATLFANHPSTTAPSLTFNAPAGQVFENEDLQIAFGLNNASPYNAYMQTRFVSAPFHRNLAINPLGGNVGIGTNSPATKLDLGSTQAGGMQFLYDTTQAYRHQILNYWNSGTDSRMDFNIGRTANVAPVTVMSVGYGGNVGIGTNSPDAKLDILGKALNLGANNGSWTARTSGVVKSGFITAPHYVNAEEDITGMIIIGNTTENEISIGGGTSDYNAATKISFFTATNSSTVTGTETMRIYGNGNVGIGTGSAIPNRRLTVQSGSYTYPSTGIDTNSFFAIANNSWAGMNILSSNGTGGFIDFGDTDYGHRGRILYGHATDYMVFHTAGTERMRIDSSGAITTDVTGEVTIPFYIDGYRTGVQQIWLNNSRAANSSNGRGTKLILGAGNTIGAYFTHYTSGSTGNGVLDIGVQYTGVTTQSGLEFNTNSNRTVLKSVGNSGYTSFESSDGTERMRIFADGDVSMGQFTTTQAPANGILKIRTSGSTANVCYPLLYVGGSTHLATRQYGIGMDPEGYADRMKMFFGVDGMGNGYSFGDFVWNINTGVNNDTVSPTDERMRLDKGGDLKLKTGNLAITDTSKGILLGGTGTANQLRIYQHGTWAPSIYYQNATDRANATNSTQVGLYTRIGNMCMVQFRLVWNQASGTPAVDNIGIQNLPFQGSTTNTYAEVPCFIKNYTGGPSPRGNLTLTLPGANSVIALFNDTNFVGNMGNAIGSGTKEMRFSFTYTTNG